MVRLELWIGVCGNREEKALRAFEQGLPQLAIDEAVGQQSYPLARTLCQQGVTVAITAICMHFTQLSAVMLAGVICTA